MKRTINRWENSKGDGEMYVSYTCAQKCEGENEFAYIKVRFGKDCPRIPITKKFVIETTSENLKYKLGELNGKKIAVLDTIWINDFQPEGFAQVKEEDIIPF